MALVGLADNLSLNHVSGKELLFHLWNFALLANRIAVNLSPADIIKKEAYFDLQIALGVLVAMGALHQDSVDGHLAMGEI